jgi:hypothetical protein
MDPELQKRIDQARAEGYSDEEINAALGVTSTTKATMPEGPNVPILSQEEKARMAQDDIDAQTSEKASTLGVGVGMGAAAVGVPAALYYGGKAILSPTVRAGANAVQQGMDLAQRGVGAMEQQAKTAATTEARLQNRPGFGGQQVRPVSPTPTYNVPTANTPQMRAPLPTATPVAPGPIPGAPTAGPVVPQGMPPAQTSPSIMNRMRALAANKVLQGAGNLAKGSVGPGMALYSGSLNTGEEEELRRRRMMPPTISR